MGTVYPIERTPENLEARKLESVRNPYSPDGTFKELPAPALVSRARRIELEEQVKGKICRICGTKPGVANINGIAYLRCGCYPSPPVLRKPPSQKQRIAERLGEMVNQNLPAVREGLMPATGVESAAPMTIEEFKTRQELVKYVVGQMEMGVHYGIIPGTTDKSLWEPGAEYLRAAFNISWTHEVLEQLEDYEGHEYRYKIHAYQLLGPDIKGPGWIATAWSKERKFWCSAKPPNACPDRCEGKHGPRGMEAQMLPHNVQDRALKRAFVAMIRNVTGTTGYFKQALDAGDAEGKSADGHLTVCPIHKAPFYDNGIKGWQHTVKGEKGPRGGKVYCNRDDVEAGLRESGGELPADTAPTQPPSTETVHEGGVPQDKGVLYDRCMKRWKKSVAEVNGVLNIKNADEINDLGDAWATVLAFWGPEKAPETNDNEDAGETAVSGVEGEGQEALSEPRQEAS